MRIFSNFISSSNTLLVECTEESLKQALQRACDVLEISIDDDVDSLSPADHRAMMSVVEFIQLQKSTGDCNRGNALTICNLNNGSSLLLLAKFSYYG